MTVTARRAVLVDQALKSKTPARQAALWVQAAHVTLRKSVIRSDLLARAGTAYLLNGEHGRAMVYFSLAARELPITQSRNMSVLFKRARLYAEYYDKAISAARSDPHLTPALVEEKKTVIHGLFRGLVNTETIAATFLGSS